MKARIVGQNHNVIPYKVNGRIRHVVEDIPLTKNRKIVNFAVYKVGREWDKVYNFIDRRYKGDIPPALDKTINSMTY